jgi:hypothetical protein
MRILVIDLEGITLDWFLADEKLENVRQLIEISGFGSLPGNQLSGLRAAVASQPDELYIWDLLAEIEKKSILISNSSHQIAPSLMKSWYGIPNETRTSGDRIASCRSLFTLAREIVPGQNWDYLQIIEDCWNNRGAIPVFSEDEVRDYLKTLDLEIGLLLQLLTDDVILLVVFQASNIGDGLLSAESRGQSRFILASANNPLLGDLGNVSWAEIVPTLFELAGFSAHPEFAASSLIASRASEILARNDLAPDEAEIIRERLSGLGYIG